MSREWFAAVEGGDVAAVREMLGRGMDPNATDKFGATALHRAVRDCHLDVIRVLLDLGADPNSLPRGSGRTPVTEAVERLPMSLHQYPRALEMLRAAGGRFRLIDAILLGDVALAEQICDADPEIDVSGDARLFYHDTYLMEAVKWCHYGHPLEAVRRRGLDMVRFLLDRGASIEGTDDLGATALMRAAAGGRVEVVTLLLDRGADVNHDDWSDQTPLSEAATNGHREVVDLLIGRGARRGMLDAVALGDEGLVAAILREWSDWDRGIGDPDYFYSDHRELMWCAVRQGHASVLRMLLERRSAAYDPSVDPHPLLVEAARFGRLAVAKVLIEYGADPAETGKDGLTAREWAARQRHDDVAEYLDRIAPGGSAGPGSALGF